MCGNPGVWFRENVSKMFNICRIPRTGCDIISTPAPHTEPSHYARCVVVIVNNRFYSLQAYEPQSSNAEPILANPEVILSRLDAIVRDSSTRTDPAPEIGVLTADERNRWASVRLVIS